MHDTAPVANGRHDVAISNPGINRNQESLLRRAIAGDAAAEVSITGVDDEGVPSGDGVTATVPAAASRTYTAVEGESGTGVDLEGSLGDGAGKWCLALESAQEIVAVNLQSSPGT